MSSQIMIISDLGDNLMILDLDTIAILLKMWLFLIIVSTMSEDNSMFIFSIKYGSPMILRYDFNCGKYRNLILSALI